MLARDKLNLDIFWLKDDSLDDVDGLPAPDVIAAISRRTFRRHSRRSRLWRMN